MCLFLWERGIVSGWDWGVGEVGGTRRMEEGSRTLVPRVEFLEEMAYGRHLERRILGSVVLNDALGDA